MRWLMGGDRHGTGASRKGRRTTLRQLLVLAALAAAACSLDTYNTTIWPNRAARGDTVAVPITSNHGVSGYEHYDLSRENVSVLIDWGTGSTVVTKDSGLRVIEAWTYPGAVIDSTPFGYSDTRAWLAIAVFQVPGHPDIPDDAGFPLTATVRPRKDNAGIQGGPGVGLIETQLEIVDGPPFTSFLYPDSENLEPPPLLRLVGKSGTSWFKQSWFNPPLSKRIGSVEFEVEHPAGLAVTDAFPIGDSVNGTAIVRPVGGANRAKVVLVDPNGFTLLAGLAGAGEAGDGPFLDLGFASGASFQVGDFTIRDLVVADLNGEVLIDERGNDATDYFTLYARGAEPQP